MAFNGKLISFSDGTELPLKYVKLESYKITPNQRMETEAKRDVTGGLHRTTVTHTASKIEFETTNLYNTEMAQLMGLFTSHFTNTRERKLTLTYYDTETDSYKTGDFYMPDIQHSISRVDLNAPYIMYDASRIAFIEY